MLWRLVVYTKKTIQHEDVQKAIYLQQPIAPIVNMGILHRVLATVRARSSSREEQEHMLDN
jgi:hypothetical protein